MKTTRKIIALSSLSSFELNPRLSNDGSHLVLSILETGLQTPLTVWREPTADGKFKNTVVKGNCRFEALKIISRDYPAEYKTLFPDGVKCDVLEDVTQTEVYKLCIDHGLVRGLNHKIEAIKSAQLLWKADPTLKEGEVVNMLANTIDVCWSLAGRGKTLAKLQKAKEKGDLEYQKEYKAVRRGTGQEIKCAALAYKFVEEYYEAMARGMELDYVLLQTDVDKVWTAWLKDRDIKSPDGSFAFDRDNVGPEGQEVLDACKARMQDAKEAKESATPSVKPLDKANLKALRDGAQSKLLQRAMSIVLGDVSIKDFAMLDDIAKSLEKTTEE